MPIDFNDLNKSYMHVDKGLQTFVLSLLFTSTNYFVQSYFNSWQIELKPDIIVKKNEHRSTFRINCVSLLRLSILGTRSKRRPLLSVFQSALSSKFSQAQLASFHFCSSSRYLISSHPPTPTHLNWAICFNWWFNADVSLCQMKSVYTASHKENVYSGYMKYIN